MNSKTKRLSLLVTSDVHGYVYPTNYRDQTQQNVGLAKVSTVVKEKRKKSNVLLLDNGDFIQGSPLTFFHAKHEPHTENPMIKVANYMGYTSLVLGNHELNYGQNYLKRAMKQSNFPWLSASIVKQGNGMPAFGQPYRIKKVDDITVAILGVTTHYIPNWEDPNNIEGLSFKDAFEVTKEWVKHIHMVEEPDLVIVCYHGGVERDLSTGEPTEELTGENQGYRMSREIDGIDVLITGHQHRSISKVMNGMAIIQPGNNGQVLGQVDIEFDRDGDKWIAKNCTPSIVNMDENVVPDPQILRLVEVDEKKTQSWLDQTIGEVVGDMSIDDPSEVRLQEHPFIEFIQKVQMDRAGVDISCTALFTNASPGFPTRLTMRDIVLNYIYPNTLKVIRVSGEDIRNALEQSATYFMLNERGNVVVNPEFISPKPQHYNYDMWEGIAYVLNIAKPIGHRVTTLTYQGNSIDPNQHYDVVMNNYRASGGGNYHMFEGKPVIKDIPIDMIEIIADYIFKHKKLVATCNNNWEVVNESL